MKKHQQFLIPKVVDPFTILKLFQTLRKMKDGECLDLLVEGAEISEKILEILAVESCEMSKTQLQQEINQCKVVVTKKMPPCHSGQPKDDCCCD